MDRITDLTRNAGEFDRIDLRALDLLDGGSAEDWIADAERYSAAMNALETIEMAAVLDPGRLRDGSGTPVEQRSPVDGPGNE